MEERERTHTEKQEGGATHTSKTRTEGQRRKNKPIGKKGRTEQGHSREIKTIERGPLGIPLAFLLQGRPMEERKRRQKDKKEEGERGDEESRMRGRKRNKYK